MKKLLTFCFIFNIIFCFAQDESEKRGITKAESIIVKSLSISNLEKDTYVKTDKGFILDRYESRPAYVFKFSDGIERRIYLYKVFESDKMKDVGMVAYFVTPKDGKKLTLFIPNFLAEKAVWGQYIDDLKDNDKKIMGFSSCIAFVLSREFSGGGKSDGKAGGEDYEYCFPETAKVQMPDGSERNISEIKAGDQVLSWNSQLKTKEITKVNTVQIHENKEFTLTKISLLPLENNIVSNTKSQFSFLEVEATANHPFYTETGKKRMDEIKTGDVLIVYDQIEKLVKRYQVHAIFTENRKVKKVYNLITEKETYLVNGVVVFKK